MANKAEYLQMIQRAYEQEKGRFQQKREQGLEQAGSGTPLFGYLPPRWMLDFGATCAFLYALYGEAHYASQARDALVFYPEWAEHLPAEAASQRPEYADGIPPLEPVFYPVLYATTLQRIRATLSPADEQLLVEVLASSLRPILRFPEWGGHNRAMLRAAGLAVSAAAFPGHPEAGEWISLADELAEESWGRWSIEDAMLYQPHWLRALILYAEARQRAEELEDLIQPRLYLKAATQLLSPLGILPDFGDSHWLADSHTEWMACLEWGARAYQDPAMKWASSRIYQGGNVQVADAYHATVFALAWKWCDESIPERPPLNPEDALEDLISKKIVWRTGWDSGAAYACLNYRDEGDYGRTARDYLRHTLAVSAEKMHHGHADENSFVMLVQDGTLLLHESGYRESPPDGVYRSGVYHNRLIWRAGEKPPDQGLLEYLRGDGRYHPVSTERLYHTRLKDVQFTRLRLRDDGEGIAWDRSVIFLEELPAWIVADRFKAARAGMRTLSCLWWTTDILEKGEGWYETYIRSVQDWQNVKNAALWVGMPPVPGTITALSVEPFRRHFQPELALARTWSGEMNADQVVHFVTVLWPHPFEQRDEERNRAIEVIPSQPESRGIGIWLRWKGEERLFGLQEGPSTAPGRQDLRPTYTKEHGTTGFGPALSDAAFIAVRRQPQGGWAGFINGTFLSFQGQVLYSGPEHAMFQEDRSAQPGVPARFRYHVEF